MKKQETENTYDFPGIGCYVDESSGSADTLNERTVKLAEGYGFACDEPMPDEESDDYSEAISEESDRALDFLNELETRSFMYWTHEDNSLFLTANVEGAREDVGFVSGGEDSNPEDSDYPAADYRGEWLHVSDHGNATLYVREDRNESAIYDKDCPYFDREIWAVV